MKVSVVIPALNEEKSIGICIERAKFAFRRLDIADGEVVVADNGSTDNTVVIAKSKGARVIYVAEKGYGAATLAGLMDARGDYLIMGDADDSYRFDEIDLFIKKLSEGYEFVMGNRFTGKIEPGAMPFLHRYVGTPILTTVMNLFFRTGLGDTNCGMRGMACEAVGRMHLKAPGMEFATEMVIKASLAGLKIAEVPCNLYKDKRGRRPHLRTWSDGWRYLRFMLLMSPSWTFLAPGTALLVLGIVGMALLTVRDAAIPQAIAFISQRHMLSFMTIFLLGAQIVSLGLAAETFSFSGHFDISGAGRFIRRRFTLERGMAIGGIVSLFAFMVLLYLFISFYWGALPILANPAVRLDIAVLAISFFIIGVQIIYTSFLLSLFYLKVR